MLLVGVGGFFGAAARGAVAEAVPALDGFAVATFAVNVSGAFLLGVLLEALVRAGEDVGGRRRARLVLGTGFIGSYTTYSTFALESALALGRAHWVLATAYVVLSLLAGLFAVAAGIAVAAGRHPVRERRPTPRDVPEEAAGR